MPRKFSTQDIQDVDIDQIVISRSRNDQDQFEVRIRSSATVTLVDDIDPSRTTRFQLNLNKLISQLQIGPAVNQIRQAILNEFKSQIA